MRILEIQLAGSIKPGQAVPETFVTIRRKLQAEAIEVTLITADGERKHHVEPDCDEDMYSMAECIQYHLDGYTGTKSMIYDVYQRLQDFVY